jgi:hypothetical protein
MFALANCCENAVDVVRLTNDGTALKDWTTELIKQVFPKFANPAIPGGCV